MTITEAGVYDMPAEQYHADPITGGSLSASGARLLLPPNCPARYRYDRDNPPTSTSTFDLGHAAHRLILGAGPDIVRVEADSWRTNKAKETRDEAHANGLTPLLAADHDRVIAMARALRQHPEASALFAPGSGQPERTLVWRTGTVWRRARLDWLPVSPARGQRMLLADYKSARTASPEALDRVINDHGYHLQGAWYVDGVKSLGLAEDVAYMLVVQEKEPPYLVSVDQLDDAAMRIGAMLARQAVDVYRECVESGRWPGYSDEVELIGLPPWVENQYQEMSGRG